jgi:uncharacterized delta-60 repeat protein
VARFNSDGSLDTTFGNAGIASPSSALATGSAGVGGVGENPQIFVEPDGNIVLAGLEPDTGGGGADDLVLAEFQADGQPDDSFGTSGIKLYDLSAAASSCDAAYQPGGDIVAVVGLSAGSGSTEVLAFTSTGSLVSGFTGSGSFTTTAIKSDPLVAIQPNGSIDVAGGNGSDFAVVQYTASGGTGWTHSSAGTGGVGALAVQPGGRIVAAVDDVIGSTHSWRLYGFTASGSADSTFDGLGAISGLTGSAAALAMEPNGDILLAGQGESDAFFAQYSAGGPAVAVSEPDVAPTGLSVTASPATYSGTDTEMGGSISPAQIKGSFTDPGSVPEPHNVTINFGDGTEADPDTTTFTLPAGQTTFDYPLPQYAVNGEYTVTATVTNLDGTDSISSSVGVNYANTQPSGLTLSLDQSTVSLGDAVNLSGSFSDPQSNLAHTVTIIWNTGGGSLDITTLSLGAGETTFQASPQTYSNTGTYTISVIVSGLDGTAATATTSVTVNAAPEDVMIGSLVPIAWEYGDTQPGEFLLTRVGDTSGTLTVDYKVKGTATPGTDYYTDSLTGTATFGVRDSTTLIYVTPTGDGGDGDTVVVTMMPGSGYTPVSGSSNAQVTISNNEAESGSGSASVQFNFYNPDGSSQGGSGTALVGQFTPVGISVSGNTAGDTYQLSCTGDVMISATPGGPAILAGTVITLGNSPTVFYASDPDSTATTAETGHINVNVSWGGWPSGGGFTACGLASFSPLVLTKDGFDITDHEEVTNIGGKLTATLDGQPEDVRNVDASVKITLKAYAGTIDHFKWFVDGAIVNYVTGSASDLTRFSGSWEPSVQFAWDSGGEQLVRVLAYTGFGCEQADATFAVNMPAAAATATVSKGDNNDGAHVIRYTDQISNKGVAFISFGNTARVKGQFVVIDQTDQGIHFKIKNSTPGWQYCWEQVATVDSLTVNDDPQSLLNLQVPKNTGSDGTFPYLEGDAGVPVDAGDSPGLELYNPSHGDYNISATMWLMCRKDEDAIWIPLLKIGWSWSLTATYNTNKPIVVSSKPNPGPGTTIALQSAIDEFPEWSHYLSKKPNLVPKK